MTKTEIKHLRKSLGLSTADFGKLFGVSRRTVEGWEGGKKPNPSALVMLNKLKEE